ncbi:hypothetical protein OSTOST_01904 [Ostertagia ostertagi]
MQSSGIYLQSEFGKKSAKTVLSKTIRHGQIPASRPRATLKLPSARNYVGVVTPFLETYVGIPNSVNISLTEPMGPPTDVQLTFHSPTSTTISFTAPRQTNPDVENKGCQLPRFSKIPVLVQNQWAHQRMCS